MAHKPVPISPESIKNAAQRLIEGGLVAFPTETVYGLGADAESPNAIARIYAAKQRPSNHPLIVHLAANANINYWAKNITPQALVLIETFWPGPLTLIMQRANHISAVVSGGQSTIGLRCPSHPVAQQLISAFAQLKPNGQGGIAAPSANKFGQVSPTQAQHVQSEFPDLDDQDLLILDGGPAQVGIESTIIDVSDSNQAPVILRPGHITAGQVEESLGLKLGVPSATAPRVSGSLKAHYAPSTPLFVVPTNEINNILHKIGINKRVAVFAFNAKQLTIGKNIDIYTSPDCPQAYAHALYNNLRRFDQMNYAAIVFEQPPLSIEWQAVNDRLSRAAAAHI